MRRVAFKSLCAVCKKIYFQQGLATVVNRMALAAIYVGRGTSALSIRGARAMLEERGVEVILVTAKELFNTLQEPNCRLLVTNLDTTSKVEVEI